MVLQADAEIVWLDSLTAMFPDDPEKQPLKIKDLDQEFVSWCDCVGAMAIAEAVSVFKLQAFLQALANEHQLLTEFFYKCPEHSTVTCATLPFHDTSLLLHQMDRWRISVICSDRWFGWGYLRLRRSMCMFDSTYVDCISSTICVHCNIQETRDRGSLLRNIKHDCVSCHDHRYIDPSQHRQQNEDLIELLQKRFVDRGVGAAPEDQDELLERCAVSNLGRALGCAY